MSWLHRWERRLAARLEGTRQPRHPLELAAYFTDLLFEAPRVGRRDYCPNRFRIFLPEPVELAQDEVLPPLLKVIGERGWSLAGPAHLELRAGDGSPELRFAADRHAPDAVALLEGTDGLAADRQAFVPPEGLLVGRSPEAGLKLGDPSVSRRHLRVTQSEAENLSSRGSLRNGKPFQGRVALSDRDLLQVGGCVFRFWRLL
ncbi:MAG: FHA domain-containing protein [Armatimonadetes bacterium]|nr:FHA domain-containing protein [Armatimonadota bacterium]